VKVEEQNDEAELESKNAGIEPALLSNQP